MKDIVSFSVIFLIVYLSFSSFCKAGEATHSDEKKECKDESPPNIGNFALPTSQQPAPLVSFGYNTLDKNQMQFFLLADDYKGVDQEYVDLVPSLLYGITDDLSIFLKVPTAPSYKEGKNHSSGLGDITIQLEGAFYTNKTSQFVDMACLVGNISLPTASSNKNPSIGFKSPSFFLGAAFERTYTDWFFFTSHGAQLTTSHHATQFGNAFLYQGGFGRNICTIESEWIFAAMVEATGQYTQKDKINGITDPNSGSNKVYVTPSLWISSKKIILQLGFEVPVVQHLFGNQKRNNYVLIANFGWTF